MKLKFNYVFIAIFAGATIYLTYDLFASSRLAFFDAPAMRFNAPQLSDTAKTALEAAEIERDAIIDQRNRAKLTRDISGYIALVCSAVATLMAGLFRLRGRNDGEDFINEKLTSIGLATAIATIANMGYDQAADATEDLRDQAKSAHGALIEAHESLLAAPEREDVILANLDAALKLGR